jgi:hypothetical protein
MGGTGATPPPGPLDADALADGSGEGPGFEAVSDAAAEGLAAGDAAVEGEPEPGALPAHAHDNVIDSMRGSSQPIACGAAATNDAPGSIPQERGAGASGADMLLDDGTAASLSRSSAASRPSG